MGFRTIVVSSNCKLEYSLNYLVYRTIDETKRINIDEINTVIIQSTAMSITAALLNELISKKIKVIFCDAKNNPSFELIPYIGDSVSSRRINEQIMWSQDMKDLVWQKIVIEKIKNQRLVLEKFNIDGYALKEFENKVEKGDITNREGHAAKVYFNRIFGDGFTRNSDSEYNVYLNYGYSIILSQFNRSIAAKGYLTQLGIHHKNDFNPFNLASDLMEPFRPIVDDLAHSVNMNDFKDRMINLLNINVFIGGQNQTLANAINIYVASIFRALNTGAINEIMFFEKYEF